MEGLAGYFFGICVLSVFILIGKFLRVKIKLFQKLFLPSSIIAGFVAMIFGPYLLGGLIFKKFHFNIIPPWMFKQWASLPGILINVVFASLFLGVKIPKPKTLWEYGGPQLCFGSILGIGQYFFALLVTILILGPIFKTPAIFACILEIGFSGGHGTAAGMAKTFKELGFPAGGALSQMSATVGIISAVVIGITLINMAIRKGYCTCLNEKKGIPKYKKTGLIPEPKRFSIATATVATEAIEPLTFHFAIIAIAILIGWAMLTGVKAIHTDLKAFPLFPLAMLGGLIIQAFSAKFKIDKYYDRDTFDRILGISLDFLVLSAIATIKLNLFLQNFWPFIILMAIGIVWLIFGVVFLAPRMFPKYWFEKGITEFGMQSGVTAVGLLLLRIVDPLYKTDTATGFGFKQMVYEPFLGGGLITALMPILVGRILGPWWAIFTCFVFIIIFSGIAYFNGWVNLKPSFKVVEENLEEGN